ncbi:hypothetical protein EJB05_32298 [Eragrostis curvula]|uniref:PQ-loop repeat family protein / transmembrane family protein n=1 Tax=Eragrostis curvula TaxID=38414 RepID=A0A5J9UHC7_9POAL|nr:hypothetical protein EJB05_32298 [Eragrostis curvula]
MGIFGGTPPPGCSSRHCAEWARIYLKYCLCSPKDGVALTLGLLSVISWGVAEVPQIITNYRQKSTEGLSIAFLMTWIIGDLFNLVGCFLEPATLPTQFYMALLYTITTVVLTGQTIYYNHIYHRLKAKKSRRGDASLREKLLGAKDGGASRNNNQSDAMVSIPSSPIPVNAKLVEQDYDSSCSGTDCYYASARSLSRSPVPIAGTWLGNNRQSSRTPPHRNDQRECLSGEIAPAQPAPSTKNVLSVDDLGHSSLSHGGGSGIGSFLGWAMAIIYMGGRLPQIFLNMQRGHAEARTKSIDVYICFSGKFDIRRKT